MKNISKFLFASLFAVAALFVSSSSSVFAQNAETIEGSSTKTTNSLYVVVQRSEMCEMMDELFTRWNNEVVMHYSDRPSIIFLSYDITDAATIEATKTEVENYGLLLMLNANQQPGRVFLINPNHQQVINMIDIHLTSDDLISYINEASPKYDKAETGF